MRCAEVVRRVMGVAACLALLTGCQRKPPAKPRAEIGPVAAVAAIMAVVAPDTPAKSPENAARR